MRLKATGWRKQLFKAKIAVVRHDELGRLPTTEESAQVWQHTPVRGQAVLGRPDRRPQRTGQLAIF